MAVTTFLGTLAAVLLAVFVGLQSVLKSNDFRPLPFHPPPPPAPVGPFAANDRLLAVKKLALGKVRGPEDVLPDAEGNLYSSDASGWIKILRKGDREPRDWVHVGGHPLGLAWRKDGRELVVCEATKGLLLVDVETRFVRLVSNSSNGTPFRLTDNADVASDGTIYFSDASSRFPVSHFFLDILEQRPHGRLLRVNPNRPEEKRVNPEEEIGELSDVSRHGGDGHAGPATATPEPASEAGPIEAETLLDGLYFANGVALSQNEDFAVVAETSRYRLTRYWLKGPKAGTSEIFLDNLPGSPDNINSNGKGIFWVCLVIPRQTVTDLIHPFPFLKALIGLLPIKYLQPPYLSPLMRHAGAVLAVSEDGQVVKFLNDPTAKHVGGFTSAREIEGGRSLC
ncbi:hypothetical protein CLOM_g16493 [Closterium sp. NIES-68]|nr:hypothetical protein CLOM_g16493 [Closterium sp. NIES-68]